MIKDWVDTPTDEKFTAIHFATYHGNFDLIKMLVEELNADFTTQNVFGSSVIHIAAQGDQPLPLFYFIVIKNMDVNLTDNRGSTPLHWACYSRAEFALNYLLSMKPDLEVKDLQGYTPLHLAIKSVAELKSTRPVRALLLKGANRDAEDKKGTNCLDMLDTGAKPLTPDLKRDLTSML
mmetsp:Transcript_6756/g.4875  ORF Transcript_6756/g.4875 Transcript_6756/m.4875 type:complete len:178 (+) Transcript_6756:655-1188(+)|eukprot:CAMPEP_0116876818 /NCGR_PEP_ID=MMETSP0463-20121206/8682_1 /TAXON_ID=181622 /ORGANISM="Strombidinopsis sp, Strain SopsisLIS2011" /LENGTH=177 /DNA_ID=CAMNT_0004523647 /DNA_START=656 /DNA_END=1189 /DNA_ORIENTATION=+